jgi:hypothetical protein
MGVKQMSNPDFVTITTSKEEVLSGDTSGVLKDKRHTCESWSVLCRLLVKIGVG